MRRFNIKEGVAHVLAHVPGELSNIYVDYGRRASIIMRDERGMFDVQVYEGVPEASLNECIRACRKDRGR